MEKRNTKNDFAERVATELIEQLKQGTAPFQKRWTPQMGNDLPYNHTTGNYYRGSNALALMMQPYDDPRWMTYKQAQAIDAQVRKGEKGTHLVKLVTHVERNAKDENGKVIRDADGQPKKEYAALETPFLKPFVVFNAQQIDGLPAYDKQAAPVFEDHERAEKLLAASGANIQHMNANQAFYALGPDKIVLPPKEQFESKGAYYATALHELGHWTGHESRLDRELMNEYGTPAYAREELRAEISSMMMSRELGVPFDPAQHASYVGSWVQALEQNPAEILDASRDAVKIKDFVMAFEQNIEHEQPAPDANPTQTEEPPAESPPQASIQTEEAKTFYHEEVIDLLSRDEGVKKLHAWSAEITHTDEKRATRGNPTGEFKMNAAFYEDGRLELQDGFRVPFKLDTVGAQPESVADVFKHFTEQYVKEGRVPLDAPQAMLNERERSEPVQPPQNIEERLQTAKEHYLKQSVTMTPRELQERRVQEHMLEKIVAGLPPTFQDHARANFYEQQVKQASGQPAPAPSQSELFLER